MSQKRALLVGIDRYKNLRDLHGCVNDILAIKDVLKANYDGTRNFHTKTITSPGDDRVTRSLLRREWLELFGGFDGDVLFYFSGHGTPTHIGGFLVTEDGEPHDWGLPMSELLTLANASTARSVLLILDCCHSGDLGNPPNLQHSGGRGQAQLRDGVTILTASRSDQLAREEAGHGVFSKLVLGALTGGAADVKGYVSSAAVYAYCDQALGAFDQRPIYKCHAQEFEPIRQCKPSVEDELLQALPAFFETEDSVLQLDPSYEHTNKSADKANVERFNALKVFRDARLLRTTGGEDLYHAALNSETVELTPLGQFYWNMAHRLATV